MSMEHKWLEGWDTIWISERQVELSYPKLYPLPLPSIVKNANQNYIFILKMEMNTIVSRVPELVSYQWKKVREK